MVKTEESGLNAKFRALWKLGKSALQKHFGVAQPGRLSLKSIDIQIELFLKIQGGHFVFTFNSKKFIDEAQASR